MKPTRKGEIRCVIVARKSGKPDIVEDEVVEISQNKFRSLKFRYTCYTEADFMKSQEEVDLFIQTKYEQHGAQNPVDDFAKVDESK